jgi:hypothetical protein
MINTHLHYAKLDQLNDIPHYYFDEMPDLIGYILAEATYDCVHLVVIDNNVFVSHDISQICRFIDSYEDYLLDVPIFWQEYKTYEDAYEIALDMQEISPFCYR